MTHKSLLAAAAAVSLLAVSSAPRPAGPTMRAGTLATASRAHWRLLVRLDVPQARLEFTPCLPLGRADAEPCFCHWLTVPFRICRLVGGKASSRTRTPNATRSDSVLRN